MQRRAGGWLHLRRSNAAANIFWPVTLRRQGRALPKHLPRKPAGLVVGADLAAALKVVEPHLLDACIRQLDAVIEMLRPFDGEPFGRKPIVAGARGDQAHEAAQQAAGEEEQALERLEQAGAELVHLLQTAAKDLEAQATVSRKPAMKPTDAKPAVLTPPKLAREWGVDEDTIYAWIRSNELRATNVVKKPGGRPRYRISRQDADDFQRRRQNLPPPPPSPRRKR